MSDRTLDRLWHLGTYQLGSSVRDDSPPFNLQGVWGSDGMPPWKGHLTWDLNVQTSYWPIYTANRLELGHSLYDWYLDRLPCMVEQTKRNLNAEGAALTLCTDDTGRSPRKQSSISNGVWVCHNLWQHFQYTQDNKFLETHIQPIFRQHLRFLRHQWTKEIDGRYHNDHSESPELDFLATPQLPVRDSAYDIALAKFIASAWLAMQQHLALPLDDLGLWAEDFLDHVVDYPTSQQTSSNYYWPRDPTTPDYFVEWSGFDTEMSHRHHSHMMMVYPLNEIHQHSPAPLLKKAKNTLHRLILRGFGGWAGFSFPWASLLATRIGWPRRMPWSMLKMMEKSLTVSFNGLTLNEDHLELGLINQTGEFGPNHLKNMTLETSMIAVTTVQEMLLHQAGDTLVLAGGVPPELNGQFRGLRTPCGCIINGEIEGGELIYAELTCDRPGLRRLALGYTQADWQVLRPDGNSTPHEKCKIIEVDLTPSEKCCLVRK